MYGSKRVVLRDVNPHIMCVLCGGYLIQATTVIECLHSFCRSCLVNFLETSKVCPICDVQVHKTRPLLNIRPDHTLQSLVYKLVPGLFKDEMKKRREFHKTVPESYVKELSLDERGDASMEREVRLGCETISLVLQMVGRLKKNDGFQVTDQRYLLCPSEVTIGLLKRFITMKFNLGKEHKVAMYRAKEELTDDLMLQDVALVYFWKGDRPMHLCYTITYDYHIKRVSQNKSIRMQSDTRMRSVEPSKSNSSALRPESRTSSNTTGVPESSMASALTAVSSQVEKSSSSPSSSASLSVSISLSSSSSSALSSPLSSSSPSSSRSSSTLLYASSLGSSSTCSTVLSSSSSSLPPVNCASSTPYSKLPLPVSSSAVSEKNRTASNSPSRHEPFVERNATRNFVSSHVCTNPTPSTATKVTISPSSHSESLLPRPASSISILSSSSSSSTPLSVSPSPTSAIAKSSSLSSTSMTKEKSTSLSSKAKGTVGSLAPFSHIIVPSMYSSSNSKGIVAVTDCKSALATSRKGLSSASPVVFKCEKLETFNVSHHGNGVVLPKTISNVIDSSHIGHPSSHTESENGLIVLSSNRQNAIVGKTNVSSSNLNSQQGKQYTADNTKDRIKGPLPKTTVAFHNPSDLSSGQNMSTCMKNNPTTVKCDPLTVKNDTSTRIIHSVQSILDHKPRKTHDKNIASNKTETIVMKLNVEKEAKSTMPPQAVQKANSFSNESEYLHSKKLKSTNSVKCPIKVSDSYSGDVLPTANQDTTRRNPIMSPACIPVSAPPFTMSSKPRVQRSISTDEGQGSFGCTQEKRNWKKRKLSEIDQDSSSPHYAKARGAQQPNNGSAVSPVFSPVNVVERRVRLDDKTQASQSKRQCTSPPLSCSSSSPLLSHSSSLQSPTAINATWSRLGMAGIYPITHMLDKRTGTVLFSPSNWGASACATHVPWSSGAPTHPVLPNVPVRFLARDQKSETQSPRHDSHQQQVDHRKKSKSFGFNAKETVPNRGKQNKVDDICVDISNNGLGDSSSDVTSPGTSLTSPGTDATSPGTEDRPDPSALPEPSCEAATYSIGILTKPGPLDLSNRHNENQGIIPGLTQQTQKRTKQ